MSGLSRPACVTLSRATLLDFVPMFSDLGGWNRFFVCEVRREKTGVASWRGRPLALPERSGEVSSAERESAGGRGNPLAAPKLAIWLILPVVICLSQRLSHAGVSTS